MTADLGGITDRLRDRWEGLGIDGSFRQTVTFLLGWDAGQDGRALAGFREWLVVRFGDGNNLGWPGLVANLAAAGSGVPVATLRAHGGPGGEPGGPAVQTLLDLLEEFLRARDSSPIGLTVILSAYTDWLRAQPWYEGSTEWAALDKGRR